MLSHTAAVSGELQQYQVKPKESLIEIARRYDLGFNAIAAANPQVDPFIPKAGTVITIPTAWIVPTAPSPPVIIINIPEFRLYYFPKSKPQIVYTFPLGIGDEGADTPTGKFRVVEKITHPRWFVPASIRARSPGLPKVVPPGPNNPMGSHAMRLSSKGILIHGTDRPWGIGRRSSHGCLRLYPEDIVTLYRLVPKGTPVLIVQQPLKLAQRGAQVFLEVHRYPGKQPTVGEAMQTLADRHLLAKTDFRKLMQAIAEKRGYPVDISLRMEPPPRRGQPKLPWGGRTNIWGLIMNRVLP